MEAGVGSGGEGYPGNLVEFQERFSTEEACRSYLEKVRWPDGFCCPRCGNDRAWHMSRGLWKCFRCARQSSVTVGTLFEGTRKPLRLWFLVMWQVTSQKTGVSALNLQRQLGFKRYETAWVWLHKLRRAMVRPCRDRLSGEVEVDETYVGGVEAGVSGRETETKNIVVIAAEVRGRGTGRVRLKSVPDVSGASLVPFVQDAVTPGSVVHTDGWRGYETLGQRGYEHRVTYSKRTGRLAHELLPRVHRVASLLKRWWLGTHHGRIEAPHVDDYLNEFTFRFNRRTSRQRGKLFYRLVQQAVQVDPLSWKEVSSR